MANATLRPIQISGMTTATNYDIFQNDQRIIAALGSINPTYTQDGIYANITVILKSATPCQIKINNDNWHDFMADLIYATKEKTTARSVVLSADNCPYTILIEF